MLKTESYKKGIIYSTGLNFFAKGLQFISTLTIAFFFGTSMGTDIYFFVLSLSVLITSGMINGIDSLVLIPHAMKLRASEGENSSRGFLNYFVLIYLILGICICLAILISPVVFYNNFSKFPAMVLEKNKYMLYTGAGLIFFQLINNFLGAILSSYKYFTLTIFTSLVTSCFSIVVTVVFHKELGVAGTLTAVAASYGINLLILLLTLKFKLHWKFTQIARVKEKSVWVNIGLIQLNILPVWVRNYVTLFLLSGLGAGIVTSVTLSQQVAAIIDTLIISQVLAVAGIKFNELYANREMENLNKIFIQITDFLLLVLMPLVVIVFLYADSVARLLFLRGNTTATSIQTVALCLKYLILISPLMMLNSICTRILSATHKIKEGILYAIAAHIVFLILTVLFINSLQLMGYLYSMIAGYLVLVLLFYRLFKIKLPEIQYNKVIGSGLKQALINLIIAVPAWYLFKSIFQERFILLLLAASFFQLGVLLIIYRKKIALPIIIKYIYDIRKK